MTVVGGWLGSGKTTLINQTLSAGLAGANRLAVLVNDVADVDVDGSLIVAHDGATIELSNGCVCCSIGGSLALALRDLMTSPNPPDAVLIEASGVAEPARVASYGNREVLAEPTIITVVDPFSIEPMLSDPVYGGLAAAQVRQADVIHISRTDLVSDSNQVAFDRGCRSVERLRANPHESAAQTGGVPPTVDISVRHRDQVVTIDDVVGELAQTRGLLRAKGIVGTPLGPMLVQWAGGSVEVTPAGGTPQTGLVIICAADQAMSSP